MSSAKAETSESSSLCFGERDGTRTHGVGESVPCLISPASAGEEIRTASGRETRVVSRKAAGAHTASAVKRCPPPLKRKET